MEGYSKKGGRKCSMTSDSDSDSFPHTQNCSHMHTPTLSYMLPPYLHTYLHVCIACLLASTWCGWGEKLITDNLYIYARTTNHWLPLLLPLPPKPYYTQHTHSLTHSLTQTRQPLTTTTITTLRHHRRNCLSLCLGGSQTCMQFTSSLTNLRYLSTYPND